MGDPEITLREVTDKPRCRTRTARVPQPGAVRVGRRRISRRSGYHPEASPWYRAIYAGDAPVGFVMLSWNVTPAPGIRGPWYLWRLLIDASQQGRGYGWAALEQVIERIAQAGATELFTSYQPGDGEPWPFTSGLGSGPPASWMRPRSS